MGLLDNLDPYTARLFQIESNNNPNAVTGSNQGLGQFGPEERAKYGITDPTDPQQQIAAVAQERADLSKVLANTLGREPTPGELYLAHQQGIAGTQALLTGGDTPAWKAIRPYYKSDAIAQKAIAGNLPKGSGLDPSTVSAADFSHYWVNRFESGMPGQSAPAETPTQVAAAQQPGAPSATTQPSSAGSSAGLPPYAWTPSAAPEVQAPQMQPIQYPRIANQDPLQQMRYQQLLAYINSLKSRFA